MNDLFRSMCFSISALALAGMVFAQVPATNDTSDAHFNTAAGTSALGGPSAPNLTGVSNTAFGASALFNNSSGSEDTASGASALFSNTTGSDNTASGVKALFFNTTGSNNTAAGAIALQNNTTGTNNAAFGYAALDFNTTGSFNTACGNLALAFNAANANTALGSTALFKNTSGENNAAGGSFALYSNTTGGDNAAFGSQALQFNATGSYNAGFGYQALYSNTTADFNAAFGVEALTLNTTGTQNSALGAAALYSNQTGSNNIALGYQAGYHLTTGSNNIDIGSAGVAGESKVIRIGTNGVQKVTLIAGIYNSPLTGSPVVVSSTGRLGITVSSERYKTGVEPMGSNSDKLSQLRAVSFHLKSEPKGALQYGLIAEEVAKVYPELVIRSASGRIDGVRYDELAPLLLNEVQLQQQKIAAQAAEIHALKERQQQFVTQSELRALNERLEAALDRINNEESLVARR